MLLQTLRLTANELVLYYRPGGRILAHSTCVISNWVLIQTKNVSKARPRCTDWKMWNKKKKHITKGCCLPFSSYRIILSGRAYVHDIQLFNIRFSAVRLFRFEPQVSRNRIVKTIKRPPRPIPVHDHRVTAHKMSHRTTVLRSVWAHQPFCLC